MMMMMMMIEDDDDGTDEQDDSWTYLVVMLWGSLCDSYIGTHGMLVTVVMNNVVRLHRTRILRVGCERGTMSR